MAEQAESEPGDVDTVDRAFIDVVCQNGVAGSVIGIFPNPAGTEDVAIANLKEFALKLVAHRQVPSFGLLAAIIVPAIFGARAILRLIVCDVIGAFQEARAAGTPGRILARRNRTATPEGGHCC
jgi:hypothetical protein